MKLSREAKHHARRLFDASFLNGRLDPKTCLALADTLLSSRPRFVDAILQELMRLVRLELNTHEALIQSATPLDACSEAQITAALRARDDQATIAVALEPSLLGGVRIRLGSDVWDGSVAAKLEKIKAPTSL
jgi:F-type H+-transporting ATPase subunit delta